MLFYKIERDLWDVMKTFIIFLNRLPEYPKTYIHDIPVDIDCLSELKRYTRMNPLDKIINIVRTLKEEGGPTMAMGNGQIAGSSEAGDNPPVRKKNKKDISSREILARIGSSKMAFGLGKLAVLESKLDIYEDLSKEMLDKLERAVGTISENSNKIAVILERHENRLDESERSDQLILKMIEEMKETHRRIML